MKTVELFLDESGDVGRLERMVIAGVAVLCDDERLRAAFHDSFTASLHGAGLSPGLYEDCVPNVTPPFLPKRPSKGLTTAQTNKNWDNWGAKVLRVFELAEAAAQDCGGVTILAFSLRFDDTSPRKWTTNDVIADKLLDRPYSERLKDVLELLFWHVPSIVDSMHCDSGCLLSLDLPTRAYAAEFSPRDPNMIAGETSATGDGDRPQGVWDKVEQLRRSWGIRSWPEKDPEKDVAIVAPTLMPSDAIEVLTGALNRREALPDAVRVDRARCCGLMDWGTWANKADREKDIFVKTTPLPKAAHYLADLLSNAVFGDKARLQNEPVAAWFSRGFRLDTSHDADIWLTSCRDYAMKRKAQAILRLRKADLQGRNPTWTTAFFKRSARGWSESLSGDDLRTIFDAMAPEHSDS